MGANNTQIMNLLEMRFDYQSARNVLNNWRKLNGIKGEPEELDDAQLKSFLIYLKEEAPAAMRLQDSIERLILNKDAEIEMVQHKHKHVEHEHVEHEQHAEVQEESHDDVQEESHDDVQEEGDAQEESHDDAQEEGDAQEESEGEATEGEGSENGGDAGNAGRSRRKRKKG